MAAIRYLSKDRAGGRCGFLGVALVAGWTLAAPAAAQFEMPPYKPGFPFDIPESPTNQVSPIGSHVLAADLGLTPGFKSIVFGLRNGDLYVVVRDSPTSWSVAAGWPQALPAHIYSSPAVGNLDADPEPEIVVGFGSVETQNSAHGGVRAYDNDGTLLWEVTTGDVTPGPANGLRDPVMGTPAIGDVDGDGTPEVIFGALDHQLYVVNGENGLTNNAAFWPKDLQDTIFSSPALVDVDGDGRLDIVIGSDRFLINGGRLWVLAFDGSDLPGFPKDFDQTIASAPSVGDIDGDGEPEIVHGTGNFFTDANNGAGGPPLPRVYAWNLDGSAVTGWPVATTEQVVTSPALANLDGDPALEVVVTDQDLSPPTQFRVYAFDGNGGSIFSTVVLDLNGVSLSAADPVVADVMGATTAPEILVPTNGEVAIFDAAGNQLTENDSFPNDPARPNLFTEDTVGAVAVADLENDGAGSLIEVIAVSGKPFPDQTTTVVHVWNPVSRTSDPPWGFFRRDERRTGAVGAPALFTDGFESGDTSAWSSTVP